MSALRASSIIATLLLAGTWVMAPDEAWSATATKCAPVGVCYCLSSDFEPVVKDKIDKYRATIAEQKGKGKAIGYISTPLSAAGGGHFQVNREVADAVRAQLEERFGAGSVWLLDPTSRDADLPQVSGVRAGQQEYMYLWSQILGGETGTGQDFDFIYFVGPSDVGRFFKFDGKNDLAKVDSYFDAREANDPSFKQDVAAGKVTKFAFRNYYGLRASSAFSNGAHDEWNIIRLVNERRRADTRMGIANQLPIFFDGRAATPGDYEQIVAFGTATFCKN